MNLLQIGLDIGQGVGQANEHQLLRQGNYDANLGMNYAFSTATSFGLISNTLSKINRVIENITFTEISPIPTYIAFSASLAIPCTLTYIKKSINFTSHPNLHTIVNLLDYQMLPHVILVANLATAVGLIALGNPIYGGCNLTFLLLNLLEEQGWINTDFLEKNPIFMNALLACRTSYLLTSLNLFNAFSLLAILSDAIYKITQDKNKIAPVIHPITLAEFESKCLESKNLGSSSLNYRLNNYHLLEKPISNKPIPDLEDQFDQYTSFLEAYLKQDLSTHIPRLLNIFKKDEKWENDYNNNPLDYLKDGTSSLISYMRKLTNQKDFKNKFLSLVEHMSHSSQDDCIALLAELSQIGHYCPERKYQDIDILYDTKIDTIEKRSLSNKLLAILHLERKQIQDQSLSFIRYIKLLLNAKTNLDKEHPFSNENRQIIKNYLRQLNVKEEELDEMTQMSLTFFQKLDNDKLLTIFTIGLSSLIPPVEDVHFANIIKNILSPHLYVHHTSIDVLTTDKRSALEKWLHDCLYKPLIRLAKQRFSEQYNPKAVFERITSSMNTGTAITFNEIQEWFVDQYKDSYPKSSKDAITWFEENVYNVNEGLIKPHYILFFLVNQGILELTEDIQPTIDIATLDLPNSVPQAV